MIQQMLANWSLVLLPFLYPAWTSVISWFTYYWRLAWRILSVTLLACAAAAAKSLQSCPTLCDPRDGSPPGSLVPGILQARTLEWVAISFSNAWQWKVKVKLLSCVRLVETSWTAAYQAPPPTGFSRQEYRTFVGKVKSLLLNMLSRLVITFLPRSKHLLISWLQSPSDV